MDFNSSHDATVIGNSIFQKDCKVYYDTLREIHSNIFTTPERMQAEKTEERYTDGNLPGIENLYTFVTMLVTLMKCRKSVTGVDYGCGSHYFVDDMAKNSGWDVIGFDADSSAIQEAKNKYPLSAERYRSLDLLREKIPLPDASQDFVFCNAVIQHFSQAETVYSFEDIGRILKKEGIYLIIFKRKLDNYTAFSKKSGLKISVIDQAEGIIEIEDKSMKKALAVTDTVKKSLLPEKEQRGMRLFHFFSVEEIEKIAKQVNLHIIDDLILPDGDKAKGIFTYNSGKNIPAAALFFRKK